MQLVAPSTLARCTTHLVSGPRALHNPHPPASFSVHLLPASTSTGSAAPRTRLQHAPSPSSARRCARCSAFSPSGPASPSLVHPAGHGYAQLMLCSLLSGSYSPTLRMIYSDDHPLDPATLTAIRALLAAAVLGGVVLAKQRYTSNASNTTSDSHPNVDSESKSFESNAPSSSPEVTSPPIGTDPSPQAPAALALALPLAFSSVQFAGLELGLYNFAGCALEATGLQMISATRSSFLIQFATVLTPVLSCMSGERISPQVWLAVALCLAGSCMVAYDGLAGAGPAMALDPAEGNGILLTLSACLFYSLAVVRLGHHAPRFCSVDLSAFKKLTTGAASLAWFLSLQHPAAAGVATAASAASAADPAAAPAALASLAPLLSISLPSWLLILYSSLGPGALATLLGTSGQQTVSASKSQVILGLTPLWSALLAQATLGGEEMGPLAWTGAAVVLASVVAAQLGGDAAKAEETDARSRQAETKAVA